MNLALFDLDHTLIPIDSDHAWGEFLAAVGAIDADHFRKDNDAWYARYQAGQLDPEQYLVFALGILAQFPRQQLDDLHQQFMQQVVIPVMHSAAQARVRQHLDAGDLVAIVTSTNRFIAAPIARLFDVKHLIAAEPAIDAEGRMTGKLLGTPTYGAGKVTHLHHWLQGMGKTLNDFECSYGYSDSHNDIPLLSSVTHPIATNPNEQLKAHAIANGWPILELFLSGDQES